MESLLTQAQSQIRQYQEEVKNLAFEGKGGSNSERNAIAKKFINFHTDFMTKNGATSLEENHSYPQEHSKKEISDQIALVQKFDKKNTSIKDLEDLNRLGARHLRNLGLQGD
jgi:hypothetical protein|tara:strand:+ start:387 stop:722 length:336 start_codon:yes stop_codon:yes gene_type:complete